MTADDFQNLPADAGFPSDLDTSAQNPYAGNRPASGAKRATPGEVLSQGFQGAQNAGDFLGLDTEFTANQDPALFAQAGLDLTPPPSTFVAPDGATAYQPEAPAPQPEGDAVQEFAQAPSAFEFGEDLGTEEGAPAFEEPSTGSKRGLLAVVGIVLALAAGGYFYGPQLLSRFSSGTGDVASRPGTPEKAPKPKAAHGEPAPVASAPTPTSGTAETQATSPSPESGAKIEVAGATPTSTPSSAQPSTTPAVSSSTSEPASGDLLRDLLGAQGAAPVPPATTQGFPNLGGAEYEWASADQLELIWRGSEVPTEAMHAPAKTLLPHIGNVRVFMNSGDVVEGRLYAMGQERVWIDAAPGRIGLDATRVERIEVLPQLAAGQQAPADGTLAGGKRVRVRVPGGALFGKVLKIVGDDVTLALDDGGHVHVKASDVVELGPGRAVVVGR